MQAFSEMQFCEMMRGMQSSTIKRATTAYRKGAIM